MLVSYYSRGGNTAAIARAIAAGAKSVRGTEVKLRPVKSTSLRDLKWADAIVLGSPTYYGVMAAEVKRLLDKSVEIHGSLQGKLGAAFTSSGGSASGAETTLMSMLEAMLIHGMIVFGDASTQHYGVAVEGRPKGKHVKDCKDRGKRIAELAVRLTEVR